MILDLRNKYWDRLITRWAQIITNKEKYWCLFNLTRLSVAFFFFFFFFRFFPSFFLFCASLFLSDFSLSLSLFFIVFSLSSLSKHERRNRADKQWHTTDQSPWVLFPLFAPKCPPVCFSVLSACTSSTEKRPVCVCVCVWECVCVCVCVFKCLSACVSGV